MNRYIANSVAAERDRRAANLSGRTVDASHVSDDMAPVKAENVSRFMIFRRVFMSFALLVHSCFAFSNAPPVKYVNVCPDHKVMKNGQEIHRAIEPNVVSYADGTTKTLISAEMALSPLELETIAGFVLRAPANALGRVGDGDCDARGRFKWMQFNFYWHDQKVLPSAAFPSPNRSERITIFAHFFEPKTVVPDTTAPKGMRAQLGAGTLLPKSGLTAYKRHVWPSKNEKYWDTFILNDVHGADNSDVYYSCKIGESEIANGKTDQKLGLCEGGIAIREGFWVRVRFSRAILLDAERISEQTIKIMNSYVVSPLRF